jgi:hypothetical protein
VYLIKLHFNSILGVSIIRVASAAVFPSLSGAMMGNLWWLELIGKYLLLSCVSIAVVKN